MGNQSNIAPWDVAKYFFTPKETTYSISVLGTQIANADPNRIAIIFSTNSSSGIAVSTSPNQVAGQGIVINGQYPVQGITQEDYGPLVNQGWYADPLVSPGMVTVFEITVSKWPEAT